MPPHLLLVPDGNHVFYGRLTGLDTSLHQRELFIILYHSLNENVHLPELVDFANLHL